MKRTKSAPPAFWRLVFVFYCGLLLWLLFGRSVGWREGADYLQLLRENTNLIPFFTIKNYVWAIQNSPNRELVRHCVINLAGNVLLFIPIGWLLPCIWPKLRRFFPFLLLCAGAILLVEVLQLVTLLGSLDVDDLILNLAGMVLGYLFWSCRKSRRKS